MSERVDSPPKQRPSSPLLIEEEMKDSYLTYAMSVIISRALPDVRDGLKPSQRRVLVAMNDLNLGPRAKYRKCAKVAGDTSGNYHPHGEAVIYPTLVRMAQDFNMRYPLIDGQGNFGSIDGDPPAAMRYTECRLTPLAMEILADLEYETVNHQPNYDNTRQEPVVLPSKFPNLLCNGSAGIAVGMATSIPPYNLCEIADATVAVIENPEITLDELLQIVPGPDFPTGGLICGAQGIRAAHRTGRGLLTVRARADVETHGRDRKRIVIDQIPYQVTKKTIIERIADGVKDGRIEGVSDIRDESDRKGMRLVIECKKGEDAQVVLNQLYQYSPLQSTFSVILLGLEKVRPRTFAFKELLLQYIEHRKEIIRRRTLFLLRKAEARLHVVEGLLKAIASIDEVIALIKRSPDVPSARSGLMERFDLSEIQANAILGMRLQQLTALEASKLEDEATRLRGEIRDYKAILAEERRVLDIIREDLHEFRRKYGDARRTKIVGPVDDLEREDLIAEEDMVVQISNRGYCKRLPVTAYRLQGRGGKGVSGGGAKDGDFMEHFFVASTHDYILLFTTRGRLHWLRVYALPELSRQAIGRNLVNFMQLEEGEQITAILPVRDFDERFVVMATARGVAKRVRLRAFSNPRRVGIIALGLGEGDSLIGVQITTGDQELLLGTRDGYAIRFAETNLRPMGRTARGVAGIRLRKGDAVVGMAVVESQANVLTVCERGHGKRTPFTQYPLQGRGGKGVINIRTAGRNGKVIGLMGVRDDQEVMAITEGGKVIRTPAARISVIGRGTQGVRIVNVGDGDRVCAIARFTPEETEPEEEVAGGVASDLEAGGAGATDGQGAEATGASGQSGDREPTNGRDAVSPGSDTEAPEDEQDS